MVNIAPDKKLGEQGRLDSQAFGADPRNEELIRMFKELPIETNFQPKEIIRLLPGPEEKFIDKDVFLKKLPEIKNIIDKDKK